MVMRKSNPSTGMSPSMGTSASVACLLFLLLASPNPTLSFAPALGRIGTRLKATKHRPGVTPSLRLGAGPSTSEMEPPTLTTGTRTVEESADSLAQDYQNQRSSLRLPVKNSSAALHKRIQQRQEQRRHGIQGYEREQENENGLAEFLGVGTWVAALSTFLLVNNYVGPWPAALFAALPVKAFGLTHAVSGMLFGGGIILTTLFEWLVTDSKNPQVLQFYFDKVPKLDGFVVLPALTASIVSGVGLAVDHYDSLGESPFHVVGAISTLLAFAIWWAVTDVTTQGKAMQAIQQMMANTDDATIGIDPDVPSIVKFRKISNVVSCLFVAAIYGFMVLKPGM